MKIWLGKAMQCFDDKDKPYIGTAGDEWICAVVIAQDSNRAIELIMAAVGRDLSETVEYKNSATGKIHRYNPDWTWENLGIAKEQTEQIKVLAHGLY